VPWPRQPTMEKSPMNLLVKICAYCVAMAIIVTVLRGHPFWPASHLSVNEWVQIKILEIAAAL
jgi:hypothetical protein